MGRAGFVLTALAALHAGGLAAATLRVEPGQSLAQAVRSLAPGDTLVIGAGVYREAIDLRQAVNLRQQGTEGPATRIEAAAGAQVVIKGSDRVSGWERLPEGLFVKRDWPVNSQQVFVDGVALQQIGGTILDGFPERPGHPMARLHQSNGGIWPGRVAGGLKDMTDGSFFYDAQARSLYVKLAAPSLEGRVVEASVRPYLLIGEGLRNLRVSGLRFEHANTTAVSQSGAISLQGNRLVLERIEVTQVDGNGLDVTGDDNVIADSTANRCGQVGMKVRGRNARVVGNETSYNNTRGFNKWWEAGGAKFVGAGGLQDSEVAGHRAYFNRGDGIWFDWHNRNNRIHGNVAAYNSGMGIHYEASQAAQIYDNRVFANRQRGIYLPNSAASVIAHNLVVGNALEGIAIVDERGAGPDKPELVPRTNRVFGNIVGWNGKASLVLPAEALDNVSDANLFLGAQPPSFSMGWGSRERPVVQGLGAWLGMSGQDRQSWFHHLTLPARLAADLQAQNPQPDWNELQALAGSHAMPRLSDLPAALERRIPGPRK